MKPIGQIRRERLKELLSVGAISFADLNSWLGRLRRDATLNQIAQAAPNSTTGKPREMGSGQARAIETKLGLPEGWFDTDPARGGADVHLTLPDGRTILLEAKVHASRPNKHPAAAEERTPYTTSNWPFKTIKPRDLAPLSEGSLETLERMIHAFLGHPSSPADWRATALRIAADLDRKQRSDKFTTFVRAIEFELAKPSTTPEPAALP
ncbi:hypothetical protein [Roseateles asaccharophilus]|uniref:Uncharacterized protein n=1 Tax=Roseateles asaccharophilus TaxID=582607 RepID=A0ABU2A6T6_9BURK|nr:hypothetical protein [Roseateles asaccharophilus]MDR7331743.1 hypothetical protein [Roseateles asaccharophilus]